MSHLHKSNLSDLTQAMTLSPGGGFLCVVMPGGGGGQMCVVMPGDA
jgi:hypothetical protein